jgi:hypothetical protein
LLDLEFFSRRGAKSGVVTYQQDCLFLSFHSYFLTA